MSHVDFSSWPREQEATFAVYEETTAASQKKAWTIAIVSASVFFVAAIGIYAGVAPSKHDIAKDIGWYFESNYKASGAMEKAKKLSFEDDDLVLTAKLTAAAK